MNIDDIDVMYNGLEKQPKFHQKIQKLKDEFAHNPKNLAAINNRLDNVALGEPAGPDTMRSLPINVAPVVDKMPDVNQNLDALEQLLLGASPKKMHQNQQDFSIPSPSKAPPQPVAPASNAMPKGHLNTFDPFSLQVK